MITNEEKDRLSLFNIHSYELDDAINNKQIFGIKGFQCEIVRNTTILESSVNDFLNKLYDSNNNIPDIDKRLHKETQRIWYCGYVYIPIETETFAKLVMNAKKNTVSSVSDYLTKTINCHNDITYTQFARNNLDDMCYKIGFACTNSDDFTLPFDLDININLQHIWTINQLKQELTNIIYQINVLTN